MAKEVKVLGAWACPYNHRVELVLRLKRIPYDSIDEDRWKNSPLIDLVQDPLIPLYKKDIPVLIHNGKPIAESAIILEYIEDTWGGHSLLPKDTHERARARLLAKFIDDKFIPNFRIACWCEGEEKRKCIEQTKENLSILEREIEGKRFFGGEAIGLVDIVAAYIAFWTGVVQKVNGVALIDEENHPNLLQWSDEFLKSDVVKESLPDRERLTALYQATKQALLAKKASAN